MEERRREQGDKKLIWECYVGNEARVSQLLQHLPVHFETYSEQNGWDFSKPQVRGAFLARRSLLHPDEIMMSPRHTPFSSLDDLRSFQDKQQLIFCRKVFDNTWHTNHLILSSSVHLQPTMILTVWLKCLEK